MFAMPAGDGNIKANEYYNDDVLITILKIGSSAESTAHVDIRHDVPRDQ